MADTEPSRLRKTALAVLKSYEDWDITSILSQRSENCIHQVLPKSLNQPAMDNTAYKAYFSAMLPLFRNFKITVNDIIEDEKENKVIVWAQSTAETGIGVYENEYMLVMYINTEGNKLEKLFEFVDSAKSKEFFPKLREFVKEQKEKGGMA